MIKRWLLLTVLCVGLSGCALFEQPTWTLREDQVAALEAKLGDLTGANRDLLIQEVSAMLDTHLEDVEVKTTANGTEVVEVVPVSAITEIIDRSGPVVEKFLERPTVPGIALGGLGLFYLVASVLGRRKALSGALK